MKLKNRKGNLYRFAEAIELVISHNPDNKSYNMLRIGDKYIRHLFMYDGVYVHQCREKMCIYNNTEEKEDV